MEIVNLALNNFLNWLQFVWIWAEQKSQDFKIKMFFLFTLFPAVSESFAANMMGNKQMD